MDPAYASIQFMYARWEVLADGQIEDEEFEVESHPCTAEELGLEGQQDSKFMPIHETSIDYVRLYKSKFICVDQPEEELEIYGTFSSKKAKLFRVYLNRCHGRDYCRSREEIDEYLTGKYLLMLTNQIRFDSSKYSEESIVQESRVDWIRVTPRMAYEQPYSVQKTRL